MVAAYMREMGLEAIYPKPNLAAPNLENRIYPYLLFAARKAQHGKRMPPATARFSRSR